MNKKVMDKLLSAMKLNGDHFNRFLHTYKNEIHNRNRPAPKGKKNYVGIEIECYSHLEETEVMELLLTHDLEFYMNVSDDGSIECDANSYELRILIPEKDLSKVLGKVGAFLKAGKFKANWSCGLHVHLDMRNRDMEKCYEKLVKIQDVLYGMVSKPRWMSDYCKFSKPSAESDRFTAINKTAYRVHETIEIRLHHGCVDVKRIENWVNLLLKAVKSVSVPKFTSKTDVLKWANKNKKLRSYLKKDYNSEWFQAKPKIMEYDYDLGYDDYNDIDDEWEEEVG